MSLIKSSLIAIEGSDAQGFSIVMLTKTLGSLVGAPLMTVLWVKAIEWGGIGLGLPYLISSVRWRATYTRCTLIRITVFIHVCIHYILTFTNLNILNTKHPHDERHTRLYHRRYFVVDIILGPRLCLFRVSSFLNEPYTLSELRLGRTDPCDTIQKKCIVVDKILLVRTCI